MDTQKDPVKEKQTRAPRVNKSGQALAKMVSDLPLAQYPPFVAALEPVVVEQLKSLLAKVKVQA